MSETGTLHKRRLSAGSLEVQELIHDSIRLARIFDRTMIAETVVMAIGFFWYTGLIFSNSRFDLHFSIIIFFLGLI